MVFMAPIKKELQASLALFFAIRLTYHFNSLYFQDAPPIFHTYVSIVHNNSNPVFIAEPKDN